jgi:hypothetical protein
MPVLYRPARPAPGVDRSLPGQIPAWSGVDGSCPVYVRTGRALPGQIRWVRAAPGSGGVAGGRQSLGGVWSDCHALSGGGSVTYLSAVSGKTRARLVAISRGEAGARLAGGIRYASGLTGGLFMRRRTKTGKRCEWCGRTREAGRTCAGCGKSGRSARKSARGLMRLLASVPADSLVSVAAVVTAHGRRVELRPVQARPVAGAR